MGQSLDPYDVYAYRGLTIPYSAPAHLALCSRWSGGPAPCSDRFSFVELGCGDGGNLLPLAFYHPKCTFVGIDSSRSAVCRAQEDAGLIGLENVRFLCCDIRDPSSAECGRFDYVVAHGLYSWVTDDVRAAILTFCRDALRRDGLAYISYNAEPGWSTRRIVRDTLRRSQGVREAEFADKAARAIELATRLLKDLPSRFASSILLADELRRVQNGSPSYVFHEYLTDTNDGFWLRDFVEHARDRGLAYVVDSQFCRWEGYVASELRTAAADRSVNPVDEEETVDLMGHRYFHASILARADAPKSQVTHHEIIEQAHIASSLRPQSETLDLDEGVVEQFVGVGGGEITLDSSIVKAAIVLLGAGWPRGARLDQLYQRSVAFLAEHNRAVPLDARSQLLDAIEILFEAGQLDVRLREPEYCSDVNEYPTAHALARREANDRDALTTPHHLTVGFDGNTMSFVRAMDGSQSRSELQHMFGADFVDHTLGILARCGLLTDPRNVQLRDGERDRSI